MNKNKPKICICITADLSLDLLFPDFYPSLINKGYEVVGICADGPRVQNVRDQGVRVITVPLTRGLTPFHDIKCLWMLYRIFKREKFDLIHYSTSKASFLASIAGTMARYPVLLYTLRGLIHTGFKGIKRYIIKSCDKIAFYLADYIIAISPSLVKEAREEKMTRSKQLHVIGIGSSKGVNLNKFQLTDEMNKQARVVRQQLGISEKDVVAGYAGRFSIEKGLCELVETFADISSSNNRVHLMLVGEQDPRVPLPEDIFNEMKRNDRIHIIDFAENIEVYFAAMDIVVLPTYRDGFGNILIEASAMAKPVIGTDVPGCRDALIDGVTGLQIKARNNETLREALTELIKDPKKRNKMGQAGRKWIEENFDRKKIWNSLFAIYEKLINESDKK